MYNFQYFHIKEEKYNKDHSWVFLKMGDTGIPQNCTSHGKMMMDHQSLGYCTLSPYLPTKPCFGPQNIQLCDWLVAIFNSEDLRGSCSTSQTYRCLLPKIAAHEATDQYMTAKMRLKPRRNSDFGKMVTRIPLSFSAYAWDSPRNGDFQPPEIGKLQFPGCTSKWETS